jgi:hypothetical protein
VASRAAGQDAGISLGGDVVMRGLSRRPRCGLAIICGIGFAWGSCAACREDLDGSGDVGFGDRLIVLCEWSP